MANDPMPDIEELLPIVFEKGETEQQIWNATATAAFADREGGGLETLGTALETYSRRYAASCTGRSVRRSRRYAACCTGSLALCASPAPALRSCSRRPQGPRSLCILRMLWPQTRQLLCS